MSVACFKGIIPHWSITIPGFCFIVSWLLLPWVRCTVQEWVWHWTLVTGGNSTGDLLHAQALYSPAWPTDGAYLVHQAHPLGGPVSRPAFHWHLSHIQPFHLLCFRTSRLIRSCTLPFFHFTCLPFSLLHLISISFNGLSFCFWILLRSPCWFPPSAAHLKTTLFSIQWVLWMQQVDLDICKYHFTVCPLSEMY